MGEGERRQRGVFMPRTICGRAKLPGASRRRPVSAGLIGSGIDEALGFLARTYDATNYGFFEISKSAPTHSSRVVNGLLAAKAAIDHPSHDVFVRSAL